MRDKGWVEGQSIIVKVDRWPSDEVGSLLWDLSAALSADVYYDLPQALAGIGPGTSLDRMDLLAPEPGLVDLVLQRDARGAPGFVTGPGRFAPLRGLWGLLGDEIRLVLPDGGQAHDWAADLAYDRSKPVWVTRPGAVVEITESGRVIALDRQTRAPVSWEQVMPGRIQIEMPPWYETSSGMFETRQGDVIVESSTIPPARHTAFSRVMTRSSIITTMTSGWEYRCPGNRLGCMSCSCLSTGMRQHLPCLVSTGRRRTVL